MADRIEREIEEILKKIDDFVPESPRARRPQRRVSRPISSAQGWFARRLAAISLSQVMMWALLIALVSFFLRGVPGGIWIMIAALIVFATAFFLSLVSGTGKRVPEKRWRGEPMDLSAPSWPDRIKIWLKGKKRP
jgi:hypothetical protein